MANSVVRCGCRPPGTILTAPLPTFDEHTSSHPPYPHSTPTPSPLPTHHGVGAEGHPLTIVPRQLKHTHM